MPPQIDQRPYARNSKNSSKQGPVDSPPPKAIVSDQEILKRGCPKAPRKEPPTNRKRRISRPTSFLVIPDDRDDHREDDEDEPMAQPRQLFPAPPPVADIPRPTARRMRARIQLPPSPSFVPNKKKA
jgi:hypothetical protein